MLLVVTFLASGSGQDEQVPPHRALSAGASRAIRLSIEARKMALAGKVYLGPSNFTDAPPETQACERRSAARPVFFLHVHKAGGSTFAALAKANGWCLPGPRTDGDKASFFGKNGNPSVVDAARALWGSAEGMGAYAADRKLDLWATEW